MYEVKILSGWVHCQKKTRRNSLSVVMTATITLCRCFYLFLSHFILSALESGRINIITILQVKELSAEKLKHIPSNDCYFNAYITDHWQPGIKRQVFCNFGKYFFLNYISVFSLTNCRISYWSSDFSSRHIQRYFF